MELTLSFVPRYHVDRRIKPLLGSGLYRVQINTENNKGRLKTF